MGQNICLQCKLTEGVCFRQDKLSFFIRLHREDDCQGRVSLRKSLRSVSVTHVMTKEENIEITRDKDHLLIDCLYFRFCLLWSSRRKYPVYSKKCGNTFKAKLLFSKLTSWHIFGLPCSPRPGRYCLLSLRLRFDLKIIIHHHYIPRYSPHKIMHRTTICFWGRKCKLFFLCPHQKQAEMKGRTAKTKLKQVSVNFLNWNWNQILSSEIKLKVSLTRSVRS